MYDDDEPNEMIPAKIRERTQILASQDFLNATNTNMTSQKV